MSIKVSYSALSHEITILTLSTLFELAAYCIRDAGGRIVRRGKIMPGKELQYISTSGLPTGEYIFTLLDEELSFRKNAL